MTKLNVPLVLFVGVTAFLHGAECRPANEKDAKVLSKEFSQDKYNTYQFKFETSNGIAHAEIGTVENAETNHPELVKKGYYTYYDPQNVQHTVTYIADKNGYQPKEHRTEHKPPSEPVPDKETPEKSVQVPDIDDDRIGTALLISLGG